MRPDVRPLDEAAISQIRDFLREDPTWDGHDFGQYNLAFSMWVGDEVIGFVAGQELYFDQIGFSVALLRHFPVKESWRGRIAVIRSQIREFEKLCRTRGLRLILAAVPLGKTYTETLQRLAGVWKLKPYSEDDSFRWFQRRLDGGQTNG